MQESIDYNRLHSLTIFRELDRNELEIINKFFFAKKAEKGFFLFVQDMPGELLYIIVSGRVEIIKKTKDNERIVLASMGPDEIIGEMSLIDMEPRSATCRVTENSVLLGVTKKAFNELLDSNPRIAAKILMSLLRIMSKRLRITTNKKVEEINY